MGLTNAVSSCKVTKNENYHMLNLASGDPLNVITARDRKTADLAAASRDALETRNRILTEAERLFRVYGYTKTTVADIAAATHMSPANVYRFFAAKSDINNAICERVIADDEAALISIARLPLPAADRIRRLVLELNRRTMENLIDNKSARKMPGARRNASRRRWRRCATRRCWRNA